MRMLAQELVTTEINDTPAAQPAHLETRILPVLWRRLQDVLRRRIVPRHTSTVGPLPVVSQPLVRGMWSDNDSRLRPLLRGGSGDGFAQIVLASPCQDFENDHASLRVANGGTASELELAPRE